MESISNVPKYDIEELCREAQRRWLKAPEVFFILSNHERYRFTEAPPQQPPSGSVFLFDKRVVKSFRNDGHNWQRKRGGKAVKEGHERLKVDKNEALSCYYARTEDNPRFSRRSYWKLDLDHIVFVHYLDISEGNDRSTLSSPAVCFSITTPDQRLTSAISGAYDTFHDSLDIGPVEFRSELNEVMKHFEGNDVVNHFEGHDALGVFNTSSEDETSGAMHRLENQFLLGDNDHAGNSPQCSLNEILIDSLILNCGSRPYNDELVTATEHRGNDRYSCGNALILDNSNHSDYTAVRNESLLVEELLKEYSCSTWTGDLQSPPEREQNLTNLDKQHQNWTSPWQYHSIDKTENRNTHPPMSDYNSSPQPSAANQLLSDSNNTTETLQSCSQKEETAGDVANQLEELLVSWEDHSGNNLDQWNGPPSIFESIYGPQSSEAREFVLDPDTSIVSPTSTSLLQDVENNTTFVNVETHTYGTTANCGTIRFDQENHLANPFPADSRLTHQPEQEFSIQEICPEWGYATEQTKIIVTGDFFGDPLKCVWKCMFDDVEVPAQIVRQGVLRCQAPPHVPGKVALRITAGDGKSCSQARDFEYRLAPTIFGHSTTTIQPRDATKSPEELTLLVRFVQMLLCDAFIPKQATTKLGTYVSAEPNMEKDYWEHIIEALRVGSENHSSVMNLLLQELLKDKLQQWLFSKSDKGETAGCTLTKKDQEVIHMVAGLGFEWALSPILSCGIGVNFRDFNGWTALHYAAHFGREKMVTALVAAGASAGAVTDPTPQDPAGKTAGNIAMAEGHEGLAGYLSELALTSLLKSLTLEESESFQGSIAVEADRTAESISNAALGCNEDQLSLKDTLEAVRNAAQAAARIQAAFRAFSFQRRREQLVGLCDEYGIAATDIPGLASISKLTFHDLNHCILEKAALSIQKKYRGWKAHQEFQTLRQKIIMIQSHVRGYQVRKKYKVILWAVGILDKVMLRWRRKRAGLRGYRPEKGSADAGDDDDIIRVFRREKVSARIEEAVSWVISMVQSPGARRQYRRLLESYRQAKAELTVEKAPVAQGNGDDTMEFNTDDFFQF